jgi:hypothetical protein
MSFFILRVNLRIIFEKTLTLQLFFEKDGCINPNKKANWHGDGQIQRGV